MKLVVSSSRGRYRRPWPSGRSLVGLALLAVVAGAPEVRADEALPRVLVLATGGTIAHLPDRYISGEQLVRDVPDVARYAQVRVDELARVPSSAVGPDLWLQLKDRINETFARNKDLAGIVVTHGSNTVEETAYFLNLTVNDPRPVVLTAAQRRHGTLGADGPHNLVSGVRVAASASARDRGVLVVVNAEINAARDVTKTLPTRLDTYETRDLGSLGYVDGDQVVFYRSVDRRHTSRSEFAGLAAGELPRVDIVYAAAGIDGAIVEGLLERASPKGLIVAAFPTGNVHPSLEEALKVAAARKIFVVTTNRGGMGRLQGGGSAAGYRLSGDNLTPQKARILLMLALAKSTDPTFVRRVFAEY